VIQSHRSELEVLSEKREADIRREYETELEQLRERISKSDMNGGESRMDPREDLKEITALKEEISTLKSDLQQSKDALKQSQEKVELCEDELRKQRREFDDCRKELVRARADLDNIELNVKPSAIVSQSSTLRTSNDVDCVEEYRQHLEAVEEQDDVVGALQECLRERDSEIDALKERLRKHGVLSEQDLDEVDLHLEFQDEEEDNDNDDDDDDDDDGQDGVVTGRDGRLSTIADEEQEQSDESPFPSPHSTGDLDKTMKIPNDLMLTSTPSVSTIKNDSEGRPDKDIDSLGGAYKDSETPDRADKVNDYLRRMVKDDEQLSSGLISGMADESGSGDELFIYNISEQLLEYIRASGRLMVREDGETYLEALRREVTAVIHEMDQRQVNQCSIAIQTETLNADKESSQVRHVVYVSDICI